jgi:hypothetical protein
MIRADASPEVLPTNPTKQPEPNDQEHNSEPSDYSPHADKYAADL